MTKPWDCRMALEPVGEAVNAGASERKTCEVLEIDERTARRWKKQRKADNEKSDVKRPLVHVCPPTD